MSGFLYAGPSLPDAAGLVAADVTVLPPVAAGDLLELEVGPGDVVGIVDGLFHQRPAVRHKEILALLDRGVRVLGAASMGALRAAELEPFGMEGVGGIFRDFRDGVLEADDEVTLVHGPAEAGYRPLSIPLVNLRATLDAAVGAGMLGEPDRNRLLASLTAMTHTRRQWPVLRELAVGQGMPPAEARRLVEHCRAHPVDRKRADALELLAAMRRDAPSGPPAWEIPADTIHLRQWRTLARHTDLDVLRVCRLFASDFPRFQRDHALGHVAAECFAMCGTDDADIARVAVAHGVHRGFHPELSAGADLGFTDAWLSPAERDTLGGAQRLERWLVRGHAVAPGVPDTSAMLDAVLAQPGAATARYAIEAAATVNGKVAVERPDFRPEDLDGQRIAEWLASRWGCAATDADIAALDRGVDSFAAAVAATRPYYLAARYNPGRFDFRLTGA